MTMYTRFLDLDGLLNLRDLGGYPTEDGRTVAWRKLFRSDSMHRLTPAGQAAWDELGIRTVIDLRTPFEVDHRRWTPIDGWAGTWHHLPVLTEIPDWTAVDKEYAEGPDLAADHYLEMLSLGAIPLRDAVTALIEQPALFHCAAGKDRTGVLAALTLRLLGVPAETVVEDYALTESATQAWLELRAAQGKTTFDFYVPPSMRGSAPYTMQRFLTRIDAEHGGVLGVATDLGIPQSTVDELRRSLLI
ncbi:tyrosine-protein phosphatase [Pseudonocardiaceae bacterium YIM PH 21723]|nr:tyrosine-protein phosphatase [Pseudonocardiaceae bacterium YIM PH 21723]